MKTQQHVPILPVAGLLLVAVCSLVSPPAGGDSVVLDASERSYAIVDTGQQRTYNATSEIAPPSEGEPFYGQDAQIDGNQPSYVVNGDGTVTDLVTGLMWTQDYYGKMTAAEAETSVASFHLAGYDDWRLPSIKELYSLIDFSGEDIDPMADAAGTPFLDTTVFAFAYGDPAIGERIIDSQWATCTLYGGSNDVGPLLFGVNFADGRIKGYGLTGPGGEAMEFYVRYVRGNTAYGGNDLVDNADGTISDLATGLMWPQDDSGFGMAWEDALAYVQQLNEQQYLGYSDWRLPNAKELQSIVDYGRSPDGTHSAAIDPLFNVTSITNEAGVRDWAYYWTSTTHASARGGQAAVYIAFGRGLGYMNGRYVDVHGAGCQRSDPKSGEPQPYGRGPQGDVVRVDNVVRAVRSTDGTRAVHVADSGDTRSLSPAGNGAAMGTPVDAALGKRQSAESSPPVTAGRSQATGGLPLVALRKEENESFVLFAPLATETAYLIDRDGAVVHDWALAGQPGNSVYLLENGDLLATYTIDGPFRAGGVGGGVQLLDWDGTEIWSFELAAVRAQLHHDVEPLPNGNVLMISWESRTRQEALAAGLSADQVPASGRVWSEMLLEYDPSQQEIVWAWHLWDHILPAGWDAAGHLEKIDLAYAARQNTSDWFHMNSVDYNEESDHIVVSLRHVSEIWIIDHALTTEQAAGPTGDLLYRYGNPAAYGGRGQQVFYGQHDAEFLDAGDSSGASSSSFGASVSNRILLFDNGDAQERPYSRVVELALPNYENGLFEPAEIVWQYPAEQNAGHPVLFAEQESTSEAGAVLFADHISGAQRLAGGNTLICIGTEGRFLDVTADGEIVWEYVNPYTGIGAGGNESNEVFRALAYASDSIGQCLASLAMPDSQLAQHPEAGVHAAKCNGMCFEKSKGPEPCGWVGCEGGRTCGPTKPGWLVTRSAADRAPRCGGIRTST